MLQVRNVRADDKRRDTLATEVSSGIGEVNEKLRQSEVRSIVAFCSNRAETLRFALLPETDFKKLIREATWDTLTAIYNLLTWRDGWNGYDACAPKYNAVVNADKWIEQLYLVVMSLHGNWIKPNVTASADGDVVFEWWHGTKKLTVYIGEQSAEYVKVWGLNTDSDMSDGDAESISTCRLLWLWLVS